ncbi:MAG TPA: hypothetical protein V6C72_19595 [Chroococcales cyanobacterium]
MRKTTRKKKEPGKKPVNAVEKRNIDKQSNNDTRNTQSKNEEKSERARAWRHRGVNPGADQIDDA